MPQVPYTGVPSVSPENNPTPRYEASVSADMFGGQIGNALQGLGKTEEGVGNEIFARGIAMQELYNHSQAQDADAAYMQRAGELHATYSSLQGRDAVDAYPQYIKDLQDARTATRDSLPNDMAQKLYDSSSLSTMGRTIFNGAGHAATQNKLYANNTSKAQMQAIADRTLSMPNDDEAFKSGLQDIENQVRFQMHGEDEATVNEGILQAKSKLYGERIKGLVKTQPFAAGTMLEKAIKDGDVRGQDIAGLTNLVQGAQNTVGARQISHQVSIGANGAFGAGTIEIKQAARAIKQIESGGNYSSIGVSTAHGNALGAYQVMSEFLPEYLAKAGLPPMSSKDFLANHAVQDQVFAANFGALMKKYGSANDAASAWLTGRPMSEAGDRKDAFGTNAKTYVARFNAALAQGAPLADKVALGQKLATDQVPENPLFGDYVRDRIEADANKQNAVKRNDQFIDRQSVETSLMGGQDAKLPTTLEELTADPKVANAWDRLEPSAQRRYLGVLAHNAKGDTAWTTENLKTYQEFKGQAQADPADFIDRDVIGSSLPISAKKEMINLQQSLKNKAEGDPRVTRALSQLAPDMQAAGITKTAKEGYYQFIGSLQDALSDFATENKKPPTLKDVQTIGARLLQQQHSNEFWFSGSKDNMYKLPVPADEMEKIKAEPAWQKLGITPTDQQIQRIYTRKLYQDLYGGTPKSAQQPGMPVSK